MTKRKMTKKEYKKQFSRAIRFAPRKLRREITEDVETILNDPNIDDNTLFEKLGSPQELARQYLEDVNIPTSKASRILFYARNFVTILSIIVMAIVATIFAVFYYFSNYRAFEYSDEALAIVHPDFQQQYPFTPDLPMSLSVSQADLVIYTHENDNGLLRCKGPAEDSLSDKIIKQNACLLFLPHGTDLTLKIEQIALKIIQPQGNVKITAKQSKIELFEGNQRYNFSINIDQSESELTPIQQDARYSLSWDLFQSTLQRYVPSS